MSMPNEKYDEDWFWDIIHEAQRDREELRTILNSLAREEVRHFHDHFVALAVELEYEPYTDYMERSEDGIEEISHWIVSQGKAYYGHVLQYPAKTPRSVGGRGEENLYDVAGEVFLERWGEVLDLE